METVRAFIALELAPEIQQQLAEVQEKLKKSGADVKWVRPEGIHLTLKFLGNVGLELIEEIKKTIAQLVTKHRSFTLQLSQVGAFPKIEYPRVVWVGIEQGKEQTVKLAQDLEQHLLKLGFPPEKRSFKAHLTLGRVRSARNRNQLKQLILATTLTAKTMPAKTIILFRSTLTPQGAVYQPLYEANLS